MRGVVLFCLLLGIIRTVTAGEINGTVKDEKGNPLPFATIQVLGKKSGTTANDRGFYAIRLSPGKYQIACQHVGFARQEKTVLVTDSSITIDFVLKEQEVSLQEVIVNAGENPADEIIRNAIRKRKTYLNENEIYQCDVYVKGVLRLRDYPKKFMGQEVDFEDGDTSKQKMIYLSESVARVSVDRPNLFKSEVISTRVSGRSNDFGFADPRFYSFYENVVQISNTVNPRGFISPISDNAFQYYRYRYEGYFFEDGHMISKIKVIPKRKNEPLFSGFIQIVEGQWRIHSLHLILNKQSQVNLIDTLVIEQLYQPETPNAWVLKSQVLIPQIKIFGFDATGSFVKVYSNFNLQPNYPKRYFDNVVISFQQGANKKEKLFWDSIRPVPLLLEELTDYVKKDSLEQIRSSNHYKDSVDRKSNRNISFSQLILSGKTINRSSKDKSIILPSALQTLQYNAVEGLAFDVPITYSKSYNERKGITITPHLRYGVSNRQLHAWGTFRYNTGKRYPENMSISGGKRIFQLNNDNPISASDNTISSLFFGNHFMNIYSADYFRVQYNRSFGKGLRMNMSMQYQNRRPLENTTDYSFFRNPASFKPNYPSSIMSANFNNHQALVMQWGITYQPGAKYIEFPDRSFNIGSKWPVINFQYTKGFRNVFGSDVDFDKWQFSLRDNLNMKLAGRISYRMQAGGFANNRHVEIQDRKYFAGNRLLISQDYLSVFQLPQYYQLSNTSSLYGAIFSEYHLNGFLTNKIPLLNKLNWHLVIGYSSLWFQQTNYMEWHAGFENIFRVLRVGMVQGYLNGKYTGSELRISLPINISNSVD